MHQKQPPPNVASSVVLVVFIFLSDGSPARATATLRASISQNICFMLHEFCRISTQPSYKQTLPFFESESQDTGTRCSFFFCLRAVQVLPRRQVRVFLKMLRPQRLTDRVLLAEPFAQVNEF